MNHWAGGRVHSFTLPPVPVPVLCVAEDGISLLLAPATVPPSLSLIPVALTKATAQRGLEREGSIWLISPDHCPARREIRAGTQAGQEPGGSNRCRGHGGVLLTGLLPMAYSACSRIHPRTLCPRVVSPPTAGCTLHINHSLKKCPTTHLEAKLIEAFSPLKFPLPDDSSLCGDVRKATEDRYSPLLWLFSLWYHKPKPSSP